MCIRSRDWGPLCSWGPVYLLIREAWANSISFGDYLPSLVPRRFSVAGHVVTSYTCVAPGWISDFAVRDISDFFYFYILGIGTHADSKTVQIFSSERILHFFVGGPGGAFRRSSVF